MKYTIRILFVWLCFMPTGLLSQIRVGEWRDHLPYSHAIKVFYGDNKIFCITNGGLFYYDIEDHSVNRLSKVQGLSDIGFSSGCWDEEGKTLILGYSNGNIDLVSGNTIYNIPDLEQKQMSGDKTINEIKCLGNIAYLSCGFGIVAFDIRKREIKDTYRIGPGNTEKRVNSTAFKDGFLYAATDAGIYKADTASNLLDAGNWQKVQNIPLPDGVYKFLEVFNDKVYVTSGLNIMYVEEESGWNFKIVLGETVSGFRVYSEGFIFALQNSISVYNTQYYLTQKIPVSRGRDVVHVNGVFWTASYDDGLVRIDGGVSDDGVYPNGPWFSEAYDIEISENMVWVGAGSGVTKWHDIGSYSFTEGQGWKNLNYTVLPELSTVRNLAVMAIHPANPNIVFGGSYGYGLVEFNNCEIDNIFNQDNSPLRNIEGYTENYINITGLKFDNDYNLWILTSMISDPIDVLKADGSWYTFDFQFNSFGFNQRVEDLIITKDGYKCFLLTGNTLYGLFVFDNQGNFSNQGLRKKFISVKTQEGEVVDHVYSIKEDLDGNIWVGTNKGPIVYYNFTNIFNEQDPHGNQIVIPRNDGTEYGDPLLGASSITAIDIDGANRKWFGTAGSGVFLISADGYKQIHNFTSTNTPLFADRINDIAINQNTGEVFIATEKGMLSYRGDATSGDDDFKDVYVFPNPVREGFEGDVVITGLARNANVKITDISGNLVYETTALGGQALWDGRSLNGKRVHTGVYLVFCTNEDASKIHMTKLLFIN